MAALKWLREHTVHIIQPFVKLTCQLFVSKGLRWLSMCAPCLKLDDFFTTAYMCHVMKPCQVSCFLGDFFDLVGFKNQDSHCFRMTTCL